MDKEFIIPVLVGFGDGISDAGIKYLDNIAGTKNKPVLKRASTWGHIAVGAIATVASYMYLKGNARLMGAIIAGRHFGKVASDIVEAYAEGQPILELAEEGVEEGEVTVEEITPASKSETVVQPTTQPKAEAGVSF